MITGDDKIMEQNYVSKLLGQLKIGETTQGWLHALLHALDVPRGELPSILILDDFDSATDMNLDFLRSLYSEMNVLNAKKNIFIFVMTANKQVANQICSLNGGVRIQPLPGYGTGSKTSPTWNEEEWPRDLLIQAICNEYPGKIQDGR